MTSVLNVDTIADKAGTGPVGLTKQQAAKAWSNFNGDNVTSGSDLTGVRDSFGYSSLVDHNLTNSMSDANYIFTGVSDSYADAGTVRGHGGWDIDHWATVPTASLFRTRVSYSGGGDGLAYDPEYQFTVVHGDLA
jgi:hypothetical protein